MKVDKVSKLITGYEVTDASVHDSQVLPKLVDERDAHHEVFAFMTNTMRGLRIRSIGIERARTNIGMINLVYIISRYALLQRIGSAQ